MNDRQTAPNKSTTIKEQLLRGMRAGRFTHRLPSENELAATFGVSRMTARKALTDLEAQGMVERIQGKGSFVKRPDPAMGYFTVQPSWRQAQELQVAYTSQVLEMRSLQQPPPSVARRLSYDGMTVLARRLHCFDGRPARYEIRHLRGDLCGSVLFEDLETMSIHEILVNRLDLPLTRVWQRITAEVLNSATAAILDAPTGHPAFHILRTTYTHETPVTCVEYFIRGELAFEDSFIPGHAGPPPNVGFGH